jgi:hypothetical protein
MTSEYKEVTDVIEVPKNTGVKGFLRVVEDILKRPRVQNIEIDSRGKVSYRYFARAGEEKLPLNTNFDTLMPYMAIRNGIAVELADPSPNAPTALGQLFDMATADHLFPVAWAAGAQSRFWDWYSSSTRLTLSSREELFGLPFLTDRSIPDETLVLGAAYARGASLVDLRKSYKIVIPQVQL